ncbi:hypothetical protein SAMN02910456_00038 [Ruminococcaceae bacterium YRB3002]|nr:hypothetical protein SAMN02910456_00038 [Ruminococcaceae bacterium YRB3002]
MIKSVIINGNVMNYELERKRIRNINLRIRPDGSIYVSCPMRVTDAEVEKFILAKKDFILRALSTVNERHVNNPSPKVLKCGTIVKIEGRERTVNIVESVGNRVTLMDDVLLICTRNINDDDSVNRVYNKWRNEYIKEKILILCDEVCPFYMKLGARKPVAIKFRTMKSRWGSCNPSKGIITFNYNLIEVPPECVRYVVVHEFSHLLVPNHSDRFYRFVALLEPDWRERRRMLNGY